MVFGQSRAERQTVHRLACCPLLLPAQLTADSGELVSQLMVHALQLPGKCHDALIVAGGHKDMVLLVWGPHAEFVRAGRMRKWNTVAPKTSRCRMTYSRRTREC